MATALEYPHIIHHEGDVARLKDHPRFKIWLFVKLAAGMNFDVNRMLEAWPFLTAAEIHAALAYYHDHRDDIDTLIEEKRRMVEEIRAAAPPSELRERLARIKREQAATSIDAIEASEMEGIEKSSLALLRSAREFVQTAGGVEQAKAALECVSAIQRP